MSTNQEMLDGRRNAIGLLAASLRQDGRAAAAMLGMWDDASTIALVTLTSMYLTSAFGEERALEFIQETALQLSEQQV